MTPERRMQLETMNMFANPKFVRQAVQSIGRMILSRPAEEPIAYTDKDNVETYNSKVERYTYNSLIKDLATLTDESGAPRKPTELEMIFGCQAQHMRHNPASFVAVLDRIGAKPVDETKVQHVEDNEFDKLTDEELEYLAELRKQKQLAAASKIEETVETPSED